MSLIDPVLLISNQQAFIHSLTAVPQYLDALASTASSEATFDLGGRSLLE